MLRPKLNRVWTSASSVARRDPGDTKYNQGWISEIPTYQVLNYLQYKVDTTLLALAERGVFEWGTDVQYGLNSLVWDETNKTIYVSTVGSPDRTKAPSANPTQWVASSIQVSRASYDTVVAAINTHIADVTSNPHKLTAGMLGAYSKTEIDNIVTQYRALVANHVNDKANPHGVTASQAGAVPSTGGTYTGDVTFNAGVWFDSGKVNGIVKTGGLYMKNGAGMIGIDSSGVGRVGTGTTPPKIVTESSFPDLKATQEVNYAVPEPIFRMAFVGTVAPDVGQGTVWDESPAYNIDNGYCYYYDPVALKNVTGTSRLLTSGSPFTMSVDLKSPDGRDSTSTAWNFVLGLEALHLLGIDNGQYCIETYVATGGGTTTFARTTLTGPVNQWYRFVISFDGATYRLYINGILASSQAGSSWVGVNNATFRMGFNAKTTSKRRWNVRNFRLWSEALTDKQVSTL